MDKIFANPLITIHDYAFYFEYSKNSGLYDNVLDSEYWIRFYPFTKPIIVDIIYQFSFNSVDENILNNNIKFTLFTHNNKIYTNIVISVKDYYKDIIMKIIKIPESIDDLILQSCLCETGGKYSLSVNTEVQKFLCFRKTDSKILFGDIFEELKKLKF